MCLSLPFCDASQVGFSHIECTWNVPLRNNQKCGVLTTGSWSTNCVLLRLRWCTTYLRYMSPAPQNGFRERKVYHNFVLILYNFVHGIPNFVHHSLMHYPQLKFGGWWNAAPWNIFQDKKLDHNFVFILYNFVHQVQNVVHPSSFS